MSLIPKFRPYTAPGGEPDAPYDHHEQIMANFVAQAESYAHSYKWGMLGGYGIAVILACVVAWQSVQTTIVTYVVEVVEMEGKKQVVNVSRAGEQYIPKEEFYLWWVSEFIVCTRGLSSDYAMVRLQWDKAYGMVTAKGAEKLTLEANERHVKDMIGKKKIDIAFYRRLVHKGTMTVDMTWTETIRDATTGSITTETWSGQVNLLEQDAKTTEEKDNNPLGIWIDHWSWSKL